jgi:thymidylate synthase
MNLEFIEARDLPDAWFQCVYRILEVGNKYVIDRGSYEGQERLEFDYITLHIKYPGVRPLLPDIPPSLGIPNPVADGYLEEYLPYLMTSEKQPGEDYTYGMYLERQIDEVIKMYKRDGYNTNQAYMTVGKPQTIYLKDPPCLRGIDTRISDGKLHFVVYFRSWDLWNGLPANLGAIQLMKEYMAAEIGVEDGEIIASSKGLHIYDYVWELAKLRACK